MKAVESAKETIRRLRSSMQNSQERIDRLKKALRQIPRDGRWTPNWVTRDGAKIINKASKLVVGRAYLVKGKYGTGLHEWTDNGWQHLDGNHISPFTHVWLPKRKKT